MRYNQQVILIEKIFIKIKLFFCNYLKTINAFSCKTDF